MGAVAHNSVVVVVVLIIVIEAFVAVDFVFIFVVASLRRCASTDHQEIVIPTVLVRLMETYLRSKHTKCYY